MKRIRLVEDRKIELKMKPVDFNEVGGYLK